MVSAVPCDGELPLVDDGDTSAPGQRDVSPVDRHCAWCEGVIAGSTRRDARFCSKKCRQASHRFGIRRCELERAAEPKLLAYADPPYPGKASLYPEDREVDHSSLIDELTAFDGWALSTSSEALRDVLALCPRDVRVGAYVKSPRRVRARHALQSWEPVIYKPAREVAPAAGARQVLDSVVARGRFRAFPGAMIGMKPPAFSVWMFELLDARPGDTFIDLFPGSGAVSLAWRRFAGESDASPITAADASLGPAGVAS